ncbi:heavy metal translocating P-type ATPase [Spirulina subsalsa FACHB-351]|uniref:Heavy metal translocating P-type ATPase n=1 Tax=Spirulina subsalsa FACHB-351 TaxID=234711 RepID=A0ABT3L9J7_9CYAN|nr:heavy metal translocating P-type ATPase [Spirulina subsalsa FACHB-351]
MSSPSRPDLTAPTLIHTVPGRVRLRVPQVQKNKPLSESLEKRLRLQSWVENCRINPPAASVVIYHSHSNPTEVYGQFWQLLQQLLEAFPLLPEAPKPLLKIPSFEGLEQWSSLALPTTATLLAFASYRWESWPLRFLARAALVAAAFPVAKRAFQSLWVERKLNIDGLDFLALILSSFQGKLITPSLVITLHELGDLIREKTARSTEQETADLLDTIGRFAWVERAEQITQIPSNEVLVGETVVVYPGERIPVDGVVIKGEATIDQQQLTGESMPIVAVPGTLVYASTLVRSGQIRLTCERVGEKTRAAASIELLQKAPVHDTRMANYAAKVADRLIMPSLTLAGLVWLTTQDAARAASILTLDFVTGIRVSMPTAFLGALSHTTRHGILVRSGRTLELLAEVDTMVFDKTGTLTQGQVKVVGLGRLTDRFSFDRLVQLAASAEQRITHPIAEAIVEFGQGQGVELLTRDHWHYELGLGMDAVVDGVRVLVGSEKFLQQQGVVVGDLQGLDWGETAKDVFPLGGLSEWFSLIYLACDGRLEGVMQFTDPLRPESGRVIQKLQEDYGMTVHLLTGDKQQRAREVAEVLNIPPSQVHGEAFPEDKAKIVRDLHRGGRTVAFVGDGLNDSVALAYADVSISFEDGSDVARETADVVLMDNDLGSVLEAIAIAQETRALIEQNTFFVVAPNLLGLGLAATVGLNPLWATIIHNGTAIAAGLNSLRPLVQHHIETNIVL